MPQLHTKQFPNESEEYRSKRNALLEEEIELRRHVERVAKQRRELPAGGKLKEDYVFEEMKDGNVVKTPFSSLFNPGKDTLIVYGMMYAPDDKNACPSCTSIIDGLDGSAPHIRNRTNFVVVTRAPIEKATAWANGRGWKNVRLLSSYNNTFNADYHAERDRDHQTPALNVFHKSADGIHHTYNTELAYAPSDPGEHPRHVDFIWPVWNMFDLTPEGRGTDWSPKFEYK